MKVSVIGLGLIGGSIALDLKKNGFAEKIIGVDHSDTNAKEALALRIIDEIGSLKNSVEEADLVIIAVPVNVILRVLPQVLDHIKKDTAVTDVGSTKRIIADSVKTHPNRKYYVGSHPMSGTENSGPKAAIMDLFMNKVAVICDQENSFEWAVERIYKMYSSLKSRILYFDSTSHDEHVGYVSHLPHVISYTLAATVLNKEKNTSTIFDLAAGGFASTARLAKSSAEMWTPIFEQNAENILDILDIYIQKLEEFKSYIENKDLKKVTEFIQDANQIRQILDKK